MHSDDAGVGGAWRLVVGGWEGGGGMLSGGVRRWGANNFCLSAGQEAVWDRQKRLETSGDISTRLMQGPHRWVPPAASTPR